MGSRPLYWPENALAEFCFGYLDHDGLRWRFGCTATDFLFISNDWRHGLIEPVVRLMLKDFASGRLSIEQIQESSADGANYLFSKVESSVKNIGIKAKIAI